MKTHLRQLGNSKAVLLPSAILLASGLSDEIEMTVEAGRITLTATKKCRDGWYDSCSLAGDEIDAVPLEALEIDTEEWEW
jgi:antitoxin MazE